MCPLCKFDPVFATFKTNHQVAFSRMNIYQMRFRSRGFVSLSYCFFSKWLATPVLNYAFRPKLRAPMRCLLSKFLNQREPIGKIRPIIPCVSVLLFHCRVSELGVRGDLNKVTEIGAELSCNQRDAEIDLHVFFIKQCDQTEARVRCAAPGKVEVRCVKCDRSSLGQLLRCF